jgi:hypothetical protein
MGLAQHHNQHKNTREPGFGAGAGLPPTPCRVYASRSRVGDIDVDRFSNCRCLFAVLLSVLRRKPSVSEAFEGGKFDLS